MADFEAPSFSLGLDCDDSERQISSVTQHSDPCSSNQLSIPAATLKDDDFETLIVDDSEPEYPDPHPKSLRRLLTVSANPKVELHSTAVVDDEDVDTFSSQDDKRTGDEEICTSSKLPPDRQNRKQIVSNGHESVLTSCDNLVLPELNISPFRGFQLIDSDDPSVIDANNKQCNAHHYFFHDDSRIQELVRKRLPNFSPLDNRDLDHHCNHPCSSTIDYMGQFSHGESSNRNIKDKKSHGESSNRNIKDKKSSSSRKISRRSKIEDESQGWVNPKLGVRKGLTKGSTKRKARAVRQTAGHWLTDVDGKKVYVGKNGVGLSGRVAYGQYRKESGAGFKKAKKRKSTKKQK